MTQEEEYQFEKAKSELKVFFLSKSVDKREIAKIPESFRLKEKEVPIFLEFLDEMLLEEANLYYLIRDQKYQQVVEMFEKLKPYIGKSPRSICQLLASK